MASTSTSSPKRPPGGSDSDTSSSFKPKRTMNDPRRIRMIKSHRALDALKGIQRFASLSLSGYGDDLEDKPRQMSKSVPSKFKPITLNKMASDADWVFVKKVLYLTLIEDPMVGFTPIHSIGEDENGDAINVMFHNVPQTDEMCKLLCYGRKVAIMDPYYRVAVDGTHGIRVEDPSTIVLVDIIEMCRYCGNRNAPHKCGKCKKAVYCSRECQVSDWKELEHKKICKRS